MGNTFHPLLYYLPPWRPILIALWIKRLPGNRRAVFLDQFCVVKRAADRERISLHTGTGMCCWMARKGWGGGLSGVQVGWVGRFWSDGKPPGLAKKSLVFYKLSSSRQMAAVAEENSYCRREAMWLSNFDKASSDGTDVYKLESVLTEILLTVPPSPQTCPSVKMYFLKWFIWN
jgi:hypothetical protein